MIIDRTRRVAAKTAWLLAFVYLLAPGVSVEAAERKPFSFLYVALDNDPAYQPARAYTGLVLKDRHSPVAGALAALREVRIIGRSIGLKFAMTTLTIKDPAALMTELETALSETQAPILLLDLPLELLEDAVKAYGHRRDLILFNIRHRDNALREDGCAPALFHTMPSDGMLTDGLAQYLNSLGWKRIIVLAGEGPEDRDYADRFVGSALKFGLTIAARRRFVLSNDPREREKNNISLLTGDARYDVIFLADSEGEFGRYVPYGTYLARPVVGTEGLAASAWHWTWERHGAPQLNQRFDRVANRRMQGEDWAAWAAIRSIVEAIVRSGGTDIGAIRAIMTSDDFTFDTYKGIPAGFRPWNNQLRQPILLHTHNAVIARAPIDGFLHRNNVLDSLGTDERENKCHMR